MTGSSWEMPPAKMPPGPRRASMAFRICARANNGGSDVGTHRGVSLLALFMTARACAAASRLRRAPVGSASGPPCRRRARASARLEGAHAHAMPPKGVRSHRSRPPLPRAHAKRAAVGAHTSMHARTHAASAGAPTQRSTHTRRSARSARSRARTRCASSWRRSSPPACAGCRTARRRWARRVSPWRSAAAPRRAAQPQTWRREEKERRKGGLGSGGELSCACHVTRQKVACYAVDGGRRGVSTAALVAACCGAAAHRTSRCRLFVCESFSSLRRAHVQAAAARARSLARARVAPAWLSRRARAR